MQVFWGDWVGVGQQATERFSGLGPYASRAGYQAGRAGILRRRA
jgi:hypothetical protein